VEEDSGGRAHNDLPYQVSDLECLLRGITGSCESSAQTRYRIETRK
jgi:hypothetical protein